MKLTLKEINQLIGKCDVKSPNLIIDHIEFDSRKINNNSLFIPLKGKRDGHEFIEAAAKNGATATLVESNHCTSNISIPYIVVDDVEQAIIKLSSFCLQSINPKVIAVTGSNGKTTTKDMVASLLETKYSVWKTKANFNNEIGIPYTIISMPNDTEVLVIEIGIDGFDQMEPVSDLLKPDIAIITMIGEAHLEFFKTRAAIADEKLKIISHLKQSGLLIFNGDEQLLVNRVSDLKIHSETFGSSNNCDIFPVEIKNHTNYTVFKTNLSDEELMIPLIGKYNIINSLSAILVAKKLLVSDKEIKNQLANLRITKDRVSWLIGNNKEKILDDTYNSNPTAVKVVLNAYSQIPIKNNEQRFIVLGDMLELGSKSSELHADLEKFIKPSKFSKVFLYGNDIKSLYNKLLPIYKDQVFYYPKTDFTDLVIDVKNAVDNNCYILIKASHGMHLEKLVDVLTSNN